MNELNYELIARIIATMPFFRKALMAQRYGINEHTGAAAAAMYTALGAANELHFRETYKNDFDKFEAMTEDELATYINSREHLVQDATKSPEEPLAE